jgi:hypothetical protein
MVMVAIATNPESSSFYDSLSEMCYSLASVGGGNSVRRNEPGSTWEKVVKFPYIVINSRHTYFLSNT